MGARGPDLMENEKPKPQIDKFRELARELETDHVVAATGFRVNIDRLTFLDENLRRRISRVAGAPALNIHFESSTPGLYFVGAAAANSFGPMLRFVYGSDYASRRASDHIVSSLRRAKVSRPGAGASGPTPPQ